MVLVRIWKALAIRLDGVHLDSILEVVVWGKNGKWAGGMTRSRKWQNMWLYTSIYLAHYNSGWPLGNNDTQAFPIIRLVSLHLTTSMIQFSKPPHINHLHQVYAYLNCLGFLSCVWLPHHSYPSSLQLWWFFSLGFNMWWRPSSLKDGYTMIKTTI